MTQILWATYNVTSDQIHFKADARLTADEYQRAKDARFQYWHGRDIFSAKWSVEGEDFVKSFGAEIAEDDTPDDIEARAERYAGYAERSEENATSAASYSEEATTQRRRELAANRAKNETEKAEYWQRRIAGTIATAMHRERPEVIYRRIHELEADQRRQEKDLKEHAVFVNSWNDTAKELTIERARGIANYDHAGAGFDIWHNLADGKMTPEQAREQALASHANSIAITTRWLEHYKMLLEYNRALYAASGGIATDKAAQEGKKIEKGGAVMIRGEWKEVEKVNKVTISVLGLYSWMTHGAKVGVDEVKDIMTAAEWTHYNREAA